MRQDDRPRPDTLEFQTRRLERLCLLAQTPEARHVPAVGNLVRHAQFGTAQLMRELFGPRGAFESARVLANANGRRDLPRVRNGPEGAA